MPAPLVASEPRDVLRGHVPRSHGIHVEELLRLGADVNEGGAVVEAAARGAVDVAPRQAHGAGLLVIPLSFPAHHALT